MSDPISAEEFVMRARVSEAKSFRAWYNGESDKHPHGSSGLRFVIPYHFSSRIFDGGEWARQAGFE